MRFTVNYPTGSPRFSRAFLDSETVTRFAGAVEAAGFDALAFTEHPAPSRKWLDSGGHESFDPLTALTFCAATTTRLKLMTFLMVLPYRNPLLAAKQIATADVLSGGRLIVTVGAGYLRSEFAALGVDFEERNELLDEALTVLGEVWRGDSFAFEGRHFSAGGQVSVPPPRQRPHPPLWIGGNSRRARERVAAHGQGWAPMMVDEVVTRTSRTAPIDSVATLRAMVADLRRLVEEAGRDPAGIDVQVQWREAASVERAPGEALALIEDLAAAGVTWVALDPPTEDVEHSLDLLAAYGENVVARARSDETRSVVTS